MGPHDVDHARRPSRRGLKRIPMRVREWFLRLLGTIRQGRRDGDLEAELRPHLELSRRRRRATRDGDRIRSARRRSGTARWRPRWKRCAISAACPGSTTWRATAGTARTLPKKPDVRVLALLTLAIGIGANTAMFSDCQRHPSQACPYPKSDDLVAVWHVAPGPEGLASVSGDLRLSASMYLTVR